jgi:pimeloyl-ACP methyl ester carboxylesterase
MKRGLHGLILLSFILFGIYYGQTMNKPKNTYVFIHGMTGGGWDWKQIDKLLSADGHHVYRPTLTGLGERMHLSDFDIDLTTHILDIVNLILFEQLENIILVGHSYGGMVTTGVMNKVPDKIKHVFFLDATVPEHNMSATDAHQYYANFVTKNGMAYPPWLERGNEFPRDLPHPVKTLTEKVAFDNPSAKKLPVTYVKFVADDHADVEKASNSSWQRAVQRGWEIRTLDSDHNAQRSDPEALKNILISLKRP